MTEAHVPSLVDEIARILDWHDEFTPEKEWTDVERELRTPLPADYKEILNRFPGGVFRRIAIYSPVATERAWIEYNNDLDELLNILGDEDLEYLADVDYGLFPEPGGLLPWGSDGQGGTFCWVTASTDPDTWKIAYHSQGADEWREHRGPTTRLLYEILTNTGEANLLKWDFTDLPVDFIHRQHASRDCFGIGVSGSTRGAEQGARRLLEWPSEGISGLRAGGSNRSVGVPDGASACSDVARHPGGDLGVELFAAPVADLASGASCSTGQTRRCLTRDDRASTSGSTEGSSDGCSGRRSRLRRVLRYISAAALRERAVGRRRRTRRFSDHLRSSPGCDPHYCSCARAVGKRGGIRRRLHPAAFPGERVRTC